MRRLRSLAALVCALAAGATQASSPPIRLQFDVPAVTLRPDVTANIHLSVFVNPNLPLGGRTVVALHGLAHTGNTFENLVQELFNGRELLGRPVSQVIAPDLPGHGGSSLPSSGLLFGEQLVSPDYVNTLLGTLEALRRYWVVPDTLIAHSMGGLITMLTQQQLASQGSGLTQYGIRNVILLAPSIPAPIPWAFADSGAGGATLSQFVVTDDTRGTYLAAPPEVWEGLFFLDPTTGQFVPGTPSPEQAVARGYIAPEALLASAQLVGGLFGLMRLEVAADLFGPTSGINLYQVIFSLDAMSTPAENEQVYTRLTGDADLKRFVLVTDPAASHDMYIANPAVLSEALRLRR